LGWMPIFIFVPDDLVMGLRKPEAVGPYKYPKATASEKNQGHFQA
jgi:hypothetical protein